MKIKLGLTFTALMLSLLIFRWYGQTGYLHYEWPFPRIVTPLLHLDGESAEDADLSETLAWLVASTAMVLFGVAWISKRILNRNKV